MNNLGPWIPCKEKPPSHEGWYLVTKRTQYGNVVDTAFWSGDWILPRIIGKHIKIIAWIPLPEAYREEVK